MTIEQGAQLVDYLAILKRRKWSLIVPILLSIGVGVALVKVLPRQYVSSATLAVASANLAGTLARSTPMDVSERLRAMSHELLSQQALEQVAREEGLLEQAPLDEVIADIRLRTSLSLPEKSLASGGRFEPDTFVVSHRGPTPELAQHVTDRLTRVFVAMHSKRRETRAEDTSQFLAGRLKASQERLASAEAKVRQVKDQYRGRLPEQALANLQNLGGLRQQAESNAVALRGERDRLAVIEQQLVAMEQDARASVTNEAQQKTQERVTTIEKQLADARLMYTGRHPEVQRLEEEVATARSEAAAAQRPAPADAPVKMDPAFRQLSAERESVRIRIRELQAADGRINRDVAQYQGRVDEAPLIEQQLASVTRDYEFQNQQHQQLAEQYQAALLSEELERQRAGEQFTVLYPAFLPMSPSTPNVPLVLAFSVLAGFVVGGGLALAREYLDRTIYDTRSLQHEFGRVVLAEIPRF